MICDLCGNVIHFSDDFLVADEGDFHTACLQAAEVMLGDDDEGR